MKTSFWIKSLVFGLVFTAVMSVTFLVEAHDAPDGVQAYASNPVEFYGPPLPSVFPLALADVPDGLASWYGGRFHGRRTASGERFNKDDYTAAHKSLPFGSLLRVVNSNTGEAIIVEVNDRGPFVKKRVVDLSQSAAKRLGVSVTPVELEALTPEAVDEFYADNDSTVIVITQNMQMQIREAIALQTITPVKSYSQAVMNSKADHIIIVLPTGDGGISFAIGEPHPVSAVVASN